jgi:hypothetical protein
MRKTAKDTAMMKSATKLLGAQMKDLRTNSPDSEIAEDAMIETELLAMQIQASARASIKKLKKALTKVEKYLAENTE